MDHAALTSLRRTHPAWRLLAADNAALVVAFLHDTFVRPNVRSLSQTDIETLLDDALFSLRRQLGDDAFPKTARQYLADWADDTRGWLRRYYPEGSDEPHFDLTPATETVIEWLSGLQKQQQFVGTESRLNTIFELLRQMVHGAETNPEVRVADLVARRDAIDAEIERVRAGELAIMEPAPLRERFLQVEQTAGGLLADFRQLEQNFRDLDRAVREQIATWDGTKGALLESIFGERDSIADSDQGQSFRAFWDFLMSAARRDELGALLARVLQMDPIVELQPDPRIARMHYDWLDAGEAAQRTVARLSEQLRKYLDDQAWLENRRIMQIIRTVEQHALAVRDQAPPGALMAVDQLSPTLGLVMERPLFSPPFAPELGATPLQSGDEAAEVDADALYAQFHVDRLQLAARVKKALQTQHQVALTTLLAERPLERGLAELVAWLSLAADNPDAVIDDAIEQTVSWTDDVGHRREATMPSVIFTRAQQVAS